MDLGLTGKVTVITGGATGIGAACARAFAAEGCKLAICGRSQEKLDTAKKEFAAVGHQMVALSADASDEAALTAFAAEVYRHYGKIDIWINNAGISPKRRLIEMSGDEWDDVMRINLKSAFLGAKIAATYMRKSGGGVILNAASITANMPLATGGAYAATKAAIVSLTKSLAAELAPYGIRVNAYMPGFIRTELNKERAAQQEAYLTSQVALKRLGTPEDVAPTLLFLASGLAGYITGSAVEISGGKFVIQNPDVPWTWQD
ncbi:MAG: SDR family NAD(P)-dependent oxidoreductase [Negativicutes bacterium]|nr:SDR family NAD(P)-dependent oxidoreductase [Negativicutes bacterium]